MASIRSSRAGFLAASALLHAAVLGAGLIAWPWLSKTKSVPVTPVTLLTSAQLEKLTAAAESPTPQQAQTEEPAPEAPHDVIKPEPEPAPPLPQPAPKVAPAPKAPKSPPEPAPKAETKPAPKPVEKAPAPKQQAAASRPAPGFDLDALAASIRKDSPGKPTGAPQVAAPKGPSREELDLQRRAAEGAARAAVNDFVSTVADQLSRAWRPNCAVEGASNLRIRVRLRLARDGGLIDAKLVDYPSEAAIPDPVTRAAATRALGAAAASAPFHRLPPVETYDQWKSFVVVFAGKDACS